MIIIILFQLAKNIFILYGFFSSLIREEHLSHRWLYADSNLGIFPSSYMVKAVLFTFGTSLICPLLSFVLGFLSLPFHILLPEIEGQLIFVSLD
jgi:hypothetical protein